MLMEAEHWRFFVTHLSVFAAILLIRKSFELKKSDTLAEAREYVFGHIFSI